MKECAEVRIYARGQSHKDIKVNVFEEGAPPHAPCYCVFQGLLLAGNVVVFDIPERYATGYCVIDRMAVVDRYEERFLRGGQLQLEQEIATAGPQHIELPKEEPKSTRLRDFYDIESAEYEALARDVESVYAKIVEKLIAENYRQRGVTEKSKTKEVWKNPGGYDFHRNAILDKLSKPYWLSKEEPPKPEEKLPCVECSAKILESKLKETPNGKACAYCALRIASKRPL